MKVKMLALAADENKILHEGKIYDLPDAEAKELIKAKAAALVKEETPTRSTQTEVTAPPKGEKATAQ